MIFRSFATALFCSAGIAFAQAPATEPAPAEDSLFIDFEKAIETVVKNNADIQEAKFLWHSNAELASGAYGDFEPHLVGRLNKERGDSPSALFTETKDEYKLGVQGKLPTGTEYNAGFNQATYTHSDYTSELYFGAELRQHLLKDGLLFFAPTKSIREAKLQKELAYQKYRETLSDILEKFCNAYWNYHFAQQNLQFATESARVAREIADDAQKRAGLGIVSTLDYQKTIAEFSDRENARIEALDQLRNARLELLLMIASPEVLHDLRPVSIRPDTTLDTNITLDSASFLDSISLIHPSYLAQSTELNLREEELDARKTNALPTLDLIGSYGIRSRNANAKLAVSNFKEPERRQTVISGGIEIDIPLFANVRERHQIASERANVHSARIKLSLIQNRLFEEYRILQTRSQEIRHQWQYGEVAVAYHQKELEEEFKKLALGKSNYHQIFEMEEDLREARQKHLENMKMLRIIDVRLARARGKLLMQTGLEKWNQGKLSLREDLLHD